MDDTFVSSGEIKPPPLIGSVYPVTYSTAYGAAPSFYTVSVLTSSELPVLAYEGQVFKGWYYDSACTVKAEVGDAITAETVLYAGWAPEPSATFDLATLGLSTGKHRITVRARGEGFADSEASEAVEYTVEASAYNITTTLSGCYGYSTNPTEIDEGATGVVLQFAPNDGYALPVSVYVSGADYYWIWSGGYLEIKNPTGPVYISISAIVNDGSACPACGSTDIGKSEFIGDSGPMYLCNACGHVFEAIVSPPILE